MKKITLLLAFLLCSFHINAQTTLVAGDIAFMGSNVEGATNADDSFAFVLLVDVETGTEIIFTDRGWDNTAGAFTNFNGDGEFTWTAPSALTAGTIVTLDMSPLFPAAYALIGDQLFAIQGSIGTPTFIAGLQYNEITTGGTDGNWDGEATTNSTSELPTALTNGDTAVRLVNTSGLEQDNWQFSCVLAGGGPITGTAAEIRAILHNRANWNSDDATAYSPTAEAGCMVTVGDVTPPTITCPPDPVAIEGCSTSDVQPTSNLPFSLTSTTITDPEFNAEGGSVGEPNTVITYIDVASSIGVHPIVVTRTFTATDAAGNASSCLQIFTIQDAQPPIITTCPPDIDVPGTSTDDITNGGLTALAFNTSLTLVTSGAFTAEGGVFTDNCSPHRSITYQDVSSGSCPIVVTRTWTIEDFGFNTVSCVQTITIIDDEAPAITCPANIDEISNIPVILDPGLANATDNCVGTPLVVGTRSDGLDLTSAPYPQGITTITWTATDIAGNMASCIQTVTITPVEPVCTVSIDTQPSDIEECEGVVVEFSVAASGTGSLTYNWQVSGNSGVSWGDLGPSLNGNPSFSILTNLVADGNQYRVIVTSDNGTPGEGDDDCSVTSNEVTLTVNPLPVVTFTAPADLNINAGVQTSLGGGTPVDGIYSGPGVTDDGNGMTYSFDPAAAGVGVHTLTYTYTDGNGCENSATDGIEVFAVSSITIKKNVIGAGADPDQQFEFFYNSSIGGLLGTFYLSQSGIGSPELEGGVFDVPGGNLFQFREENLPEGYDVSDIQFSSANGNSSISVLDIPGNEIHFIIAEGDDVTVTFVNEFTSPVEPLSVTNFVLVNADTNSDIMPITDGMSIDVTTLPTMNLNIRAEATADTESVRLELSGAQSNGRTENVAPYALFGDSSGNYAAHVFALGMYNLTATPYSENGLGGTAGTGLAVSFEFVNPAIGSPLIVVDSDTDSELFALTEGLVINKSVVGDLLFGIIFNPDFGPNGVSFNLSGPLTENRTEGATPPYSLFGDIGVDIQGKMFPSGAYTLVANPNSGPTVIVNFEVIDEDPACLAFEVVLDDTTDPSSCGGLDGSIAIMVAGAAAPIDYEWSHDNTLESPTATGLGAGTYTVTVTDDNGCTDTLMVTLNDPALPLVNFTAPADLLITDGVQAGLGGGTPAGGVYVGPGVTDDGNGMTYSFDPAVAGVGVHTLTYSYTDGNGCSNEASDDVEVTDPASVLSVTGFVLVNADTNTDIMTIVDGALLDLAVLPTSNLNIRANATGDTESVGFVLSGAEAYTRTENVDPYALYGDNGGNYFVHNFVEGLYGLMATAYSANNQGGTAGTPASINFSIIDTGPALFTIKLYPNPAVNQIKVDVEDPKVKMRSITVHDVKGRAMSIIDTGFLSAGDDFTLPVNDLPSGVYYISVVNNKGFIHQQPFIVRK